jgi:hypothetical protein
LFTFPSILTFKLSLAPIPNDQYLLGLNEVNWIIHESTTVLYSYLKVEVIIRNEAIKRAVKAVMFGIFLAFAACRINIGVLRVIYSVTGNAAIGQAHSYAFICWGLADLIVLGLLISNALSLQKTSNVASKKTITALLTSSIPRIAIIIINTLVIVVIGNIPEPNATTVRRLDLSLDALDLFSFPSILTYKLSLEKHEYSLLDDQGSLPFDSPP